MATKTVTVTATFCQPNEGHATLTATGDFSATAAMDTAGMGVVPPARETGEALLTVSRWALNGLTGTQKKSASANGIQISITYNP